LRDIVLYGLIIIVSGVLAELSVRFKHRLVRIYCVVNMILIPSAFAGLRTGIGTDYYNYVVIFKESQNNFWDSRIEKGYLLINRIIAMLGGDEHFMFFVICALTILFVYLALYDRRDKISVGIGMFMFLLLYYQTSYNLVRHVLAISILLFSLKYVFDKKFIRFIMWVAIATLIHSSSVFFVPVYFVNRILEKKPYISIQAMILAMVFLFIRYMDIIFLKIFSLIPFLESYSTYLAGASHFQSGGHLMLDLMNMTYIAPGFIMYFILKKLDERFVMYYFLLLTGFVIQFASRGLFELIAIRASMEYFVAVVIVVPYYFKALNQRRLVSISFLLTLIYIMIWLAIFFHFKNSETIPYNWIL